jgi:hypothetical protein
MDIQWAREAVHPSSLPLCVGLIDLQNVVTRVTSRPTTQSADRNSFSRLSPIALIAKRHSSKSSTDSSRLKRMCILYRIREWRIYM